MAIFRDRVLLIAIDDQGNPVPVKVDGIGNLTVSGAGVTSGTQIQIVDGTDSLIKATVNADGSLKVDVSDTQFNVGNFPDNYPLPQAQVDELQSVTATLTNPTADPETGLAKEATLQALAGEDFATQTTLEAVRARLVSIDGKDFATEAKLEAIRLLLEGEDFASAANQVEHLARTPKSAKQYAEGKFRSAGGKQVVNAGQTGAFRLENPTGSGVSITITEFGYGANLNGEVRFWRDATISTPGTVNPFHPHRAYELTPTKAIVQKGTGVIGGTQLSPINRVAANHMEHRPYVFTFLPGQAIVISLTLSALENGDFYASATWIEEPL